MMPTYNNGKYIKQAIESIYVQNYDNIEIIVISMGNLPLHGVKLFVSMAINLSLGESIILHPVTAQALQPKPIAIVSDCLP